MRGFLEIPAFGAIALGAHLAVFAGWSGGAPEGAGNGGDTVLSLKGSSGAVEAMVASWEQAPDTGAAPARPDVSSEATASPVAPSGETAPETLERVAALPVLQEDRAAAGMVPPDAVPLPAPAVPDAPLLATAPALPSVTTAISSPTDAFAPEPAAPLADLAQDAPPEIAPAPAPKAPATRPRARPEQVAEGAGGQGSRGTRAETTAPSLSDSARRSLVASWGAEIRARVEARKVHPAGLRATGRPVVRITVTRSGALESVSLAQSSSVALLDEAALRAVRRAGRFPAAPGGLDLARASFDLPISFTR